MTLDDYFYKVKRRHPKLALHCWQILWDAECFSPTSAITLSKIRGESFRQQSLSCWRGRVRERDVSKGCFFFADAYKKVTEAKFPCMGDPRVEMMFLLSIPLVACYTNEMGTFRFYIVEQSEGWNGIRDGDNLLVNCAISRDLYFI